MLVPIANRFSILLAEKQKRENRFIPISEIARQTKIPRKTLYMWEKGEVSRFDSHVIDALCEYFGVGLNDLLEYASENKKASRK